MELIVKFLADGLMIPLFLLAMYGLFFRVPRHDRYDRYSRIFMAGITSYFAAKFLGNIWQPEQLRPFELMGVDPGAAYLNNPGFPSDHALFAAFLTLAVWYGTRSRALTIAMGGMALLVCIGRVMALVHTPLDVVGGVAVAGVGALWYKTYAKKRLQTHLAKRAKK